MAQSLNSIDTTFSSAVEDLRDTRLVACVEAYPVCPARMGSQAIKQYFDEHPHEFVTNDGRAIYYSQENIIALYEDLGVSISGLDVRDYLMREYAHLFLQHSRLRRYYNKDEIKANTFAVACEIEACRTKGISHQRTCYQTSATDDLFECAKPAKYLRQIYQALIDEFGNEIEEFAEQQQGKGKNNDGQGDQQQNGDGQGDGQPNDDRNQQSGDGNDGDGRNSRDDGQSDDDRDGGGSDGRARNNDGSNRSNRDGDNDVEDGGKTGENRGDSQRQQRDSGGETGRNQGGTPDTELENGGSEQRQQSSSEHSSGEREGDSDDSQEARQQQQGADGLSEPYRGKLTDDQRDQLAKTFARAEKKLSPTDGDDQMLQDYGIDPGEGTEESTLEDLVDTTYERWRDKQVKKQLAKLKSAIEGEVSKRKYSTYARPSRRACVSNGLMTKGRKKELVGQPTILVALDGSGSMSAQKVRDLTHCIGNIFDDLGRPKRGCYICMFDDEIVLKRPMRQWQEVCAKYRAEGGTNYNSVLELANELGVDVVIEVGDGEGDLCWNYRHDTALRDFMAAGRKWIDLLVQHREDELDDALRHAAVDSRNAGIERKLICLDKEMSIALEEIERRKKSVDND